MKNYKKLFFLILVCISVPAFAFFKQFALANNWGEPVIFHIEYDDGSHFDKDLNAKASTFLKVDMPYSVKSVTSESVTYGKQMCDHRSMSLSFFKLIAVTQIHYELDKHDLIKVVHDCVYDAS